MDGRVGDSMFGDCGHDPGGMQMPGQKRPRGKPSNGRDKPPYEKVSKRSRFCSVCRSAGHKSTTCPKRSNIQKIPRRQPKCSNCGVTGHRKNICGNPKILLS